MSLPDNAKTCHNTPACLRLPRFFCLRIYSSKSHFFTHPQRSSIQSQRHHGEVLPKLPGPCCREYPSLFIALAILTIISVLRCRRDVSHSTKCGSERGSNHFPGAPAHHLPCLANAAIYLPAGCRRTSHDTRPPRPNEARNMENYLR